MFILIKPDEQVGLNSGETQCTPVQGQSETIGVHNMAMDTLKRAVLGGQTFAGKEANVNQGTKMLRTFIAQMEALKRYRTGGQQKMTVEHVHVNEGGQAIVGTVNQGGGGKNNENCG